MSDTKIPTVSGTVKETPCYSFLVWDALGSESR